MRGETYFLSVLLSIKVYLTQTDIEYTLNSLKMRDNTPVIGS